MFQNTEPYWKIRSLGMGLEKSEPSPLQFFFSLSLLPSPPPTAFCTHSAVTDSHFGTISPNKPFLRSLLVRLQVTGDLRGDLSEQQKSKYHRRICSWGMAAGH